MRRALLPLVICTTFAIYGCATDTKPDPTYEQAASDRFVPSNYRAAEALMAQINERIAPGNPLIIATVVNIDALEQSSTLGRLISEQVSSRFSRAGYRMIEMKFRNSVYVKQNQGELVLTREIKDLAISHQARAVIVGTYGAADDMVFLNLKVIDPASNVALAAHDYVLPRDAAMRSLLRGR
ncbi:FlgO family outer membrane protein [Methyloversatilis thermotolerans]|uniref:FlgO family outer membrane protein n=1 Tax=Methyloversatilis thermotolerans TaxID=1346290 RepID=UPI00036B16D8|nr:FlgO family outer membrane protein [Methyloversatilis thermotolerans]